MDTAVKHRNTRQRRIILEELRRLVNHPTADELYEIVRRKLPRISLGTVYRNLEHLTLEGEVRTLDSLGSRKRYDGNPHPHYHVRCLVCGKIGDIVSGVHTDIQDTFDDESGFRVLGHHLDFFGICPECKRAERGNKRTPGNSEDDKKS